MKIWKEPKTTHNLRGSEVNPGTPHNKTRRNSSPASLEGDSVEPQKPVELEYVDEGEPVEEELFEPVWEGDLGVGSNDLDESETIAGSEENAGIIKSQPPCKPIVRTTIPATEKEKIGRAVSEDKTPIPDEVETKPAKVSPLSWPIALLPATVSGTNGMISKKTFGVFQEADEKFSPSFSPSNETPHLQPRRESPVSRREPFPRRASRFRLLEIIEQNRPLPSPSLLLGVCDDFLPLLMDLFDPSPGSILIMGDDDEDNREHLRSIIASACLLNQNEQVDLSVISPSLDAVLPRTLESEILNRVNPEQEEAFTLLCDFFLLAEKRGKNFQNKQINILVLDQLDVLIDRLAPESLSYLRWLIQKGPHAHLWTIASISSKRATEIDWKTIKSFGTHLIGKVTNPVILKSLLGPQSACQQQPLPKNQAMVKLGEEIVSFFVPQI